MLLRDKVAVITGGASGIGESTARLFLEHGAKVVVGDLNLDKAQMVAASSPENCVAQHADVSVAADVERLVRTAEQRFGRIDIMFNNAGIASYKPMHEEDETTFDRIIAVNLKGVWFGIKYAVISMLSRSGGGVIINTASSGGYIPIHSLGAYGATKAGVIHMSRIAAVEYGAHNIRVNTICPGACVTPMNYANPDHPMDPKALEATFATMQPLPRAGQAIDIAQGALYLASDAGSWITGHSLNIDGGGSSSNGSMQNVREAADARMQR
jgi:NAD(P)-dependent dehydrogenase (short-subunit alcohol dehydrogenase family)